MCSQEKLFVGRQAGGMGQEHAERHLVAAGVGRSGGVEQEFRDCPDDGRLELQQAAFVEDHGHGRGGDCFGYGGQVEERGWSDGSVMEVKIPTLWHTARQGWGTLDILFVDKLSERSQG